MRFTRTALVAALALTASVSVAAAQPYGPPPPPPPGAFAGGPPPGWAGPHYYWHGRHWHHRHWFYGPGHRGYWRYY